MIRICAKLAVPVILFAGYLSVDHIALKSARPPANLKTIHDFRDWKKRAFMGERSYENFGTTYIVMLGPSGRMFASGPSAYLFDQNGDFVDWTPDMGDSKTKEFGFDLTGGRVKRVEQIR